MLAKSPIEQRKHDPKCHTRNIRNPILHIRAAPKGRLDELYETAKDTCTHKDWDQSKAACVGEWKSQRGEGHEVHKFVASLRRRGRLMDGPKHGYCQNSCYD